jgi:hypothetical protein
VRLDAVSERHRDPSHAARDALHVWVIAAANACAVAVDRQRRRRPHCFVQPLRTNAVVPLGGLNAAMVHQLLQYVDGDCWVDRIRVALCV